MVCITSGEPVICRNLVKVDFVNQAVPCWLLGSRSVRLAFDPLQCNSFTSGKCGNNGSSAPPANFSTSPSMETSASYLDHPQNTLVKQTTNKRNHFHGHFEFFIQSYLHKPILVKVKIKGFVKFVVILLTHKYSIYRKNKFYEPIQPKSKNIPLKELNLPKGENLACSGTEKI